MYSGLDWNRLSDRWLNAHDKLQQSLCDIDILFIKSYNLASSCICFLILSFVKNSRLLEYVNS